MQAIEATISIYTVVGPSMRQEVAKVRDLKEAILKQLEKRFDEIDI